MVLPIIDFVFFYRKTKARPWFLSWSPQIPWRGAWKLYLHRWQVIATSIPDSSNTFSWLVFVLWCIYFPFIYMLIMGKTSILTETGIWDLNKVLQPKCHSIWTFVTWNVTRSTPLDIVSSSIKHIWGLQSSSIIYQPLGQGTNSTRNLIFWLKP